MTGGNTEESSGKTRNNAYADWIKLKEGRCNGRAARDAATPAHNTGEPQDGGKIHDKGKKAQLQARFAEHSPKVWAHGDVATVHIFGGHYCIKKRESGCDWRWADANPCNDLGPLTLNRIATLAEL